MIENLHKVTVPIGKMEHTGNIDLLETIEKGVIDRLISLRIRERPADLVALLFDLEELIFT